MTRAAVFLVAAGTISTVSGWAQQAPLAPPVPGQAGVSTVADAPARYEAASVKRNRSNAMLVSVSTNRGQYQATNVTVGLLIEQALRVPGSQIIGAPEWTRSERYDIVAKVPDGTTLGPGVQQQLLRALLEDRFQLAAHKETRELPMFALVVARADGRLGPSLSPTKNDCTPGRGRGAGGPPAGPPPAPPQLGPGARPPCGTMVGPGLISSGGITMTRLAELLSNSTGRTVVDRTGLAGFYDLDIAFTPDQIPQPPGPLPPGVQMPAIDPNGPPLQTAVQEQLGLKLESSRGPVEVTVIDRLERPTED